LALETMSAPTRADRELMTEFHRKTEDPTVQGQARRWLTRIRAEHAMRLGAEAAPARRALRLGHVAPIACSASVGLLICSAADALSRATRGSPQLVFWTGALLIVLPVFFRLTSSAASPRERLALVCLLGLALYAIKLLRDPYTYTFPDELAHSYNAQQIALHHKLFNANPILAVTPKYPGLEGATSALMSLTGLSSFGAGRIVLGAARLVEVAGLFLLFSRLSRSARAGGLGAAIYTANANFLFFGAQFSYESLALPLLIVVLVAVAERAAQPPSRAAAWAVPIVLGTGAVVVTHHLTAYALAIILVALTAMQFVLRRRTSAPSPWPFALLAVALCVVWLVVVASTTVGYLSPVLSRAFNATVHTISGESAPRKLFSATGAGSSTTAAPAIEQALAFISVALLAAGLPFGLRQIWRRHRAQPFAFILGAAAVALFATFPLRFAPLAWETANRAAEFLFIGLAFVLGFVGVAVLTRRPRRWPARAILTGCFAVVFAGGVISGWPTSTRLSQPLRVSAQGHVIESERLALSRWVAAHLPGGRFVAADLDARLLLDFGRANAFAGHSSSDFADIITTDKLAPFELAILRDNRIRYVLEDRQVDPNLFFSVRPGGGVKEELLSPAAVLKFESLPAAAVFDSGQLIVYDLRDRP
jgi:hypothetical protein